MVPHSPSRSHLATNDVPSVNAPQNTAEAGQTDIDAEVGAFSHLNSNTKGETKITRRYIKNLLVEKLRVVLPWN